MHVILETIINHVYFYYYILEAIVLFFVPARFRCKKVEGQVVLITGAGSGLGRLMAIRFAKLGCRLVLWDMNSDSNKETAAECEELGAQVNAYTCDLGRRDNVYSVANKVKDEVGDVDILINNAGIVTGKKILDCSDAMMQKTMDVNAVAHFWTVKSFLPAMLARNHGHIVTIASAAGLFGTNGLVDYCASKFAAVGFDETLRAELWVQKKTGVHTTVVCPFYISTGMFEGAKTRFPSILPILEPDYVADKIVEAVLTNKAMLCLPNFIYMMLALKNILPVKALMLSSDFVGFSNSMDEFRGRQKHQ